MSQSPIISWKDRMQGCKQNDVQAFFKEFGMTSLRCFSQGLELALESKYPEWVMGQVMCTFGEEPETSVVDLVGRCVRDSRECTCFGDSDEFRLMRQILIDPFYLMNEKEKEELENGSNTRNY